MKQSGLEEYSKYLLQGEKYSDKLQTTRHSYDVVSGQPMAIVDSLNDDYYTSTAQQSNLNSFRVYVKDLLEKKFSMKSVRQNQSSPRHSGRESQGQLESEVVTL